MIGSPGSRATDQPQSYPNCRGPTVAVIASGELRVMAVTPRCIRGRVLGINWLAVDGRSIMGGCGCGGGEHGTHGAPGSSASTSDDLAFNISVEPFGPPTTVVEAAARAVVAHPAVRAFLDGEDHRLLTFGLLDDPVDPCACHERKPAGRPPSEFRATIYD